MTTPNPWERLRKAALRLTRSVNKLVHPLHDNALRRDAMESVDAVQAALAALPPAQTDADPPQRYSDDRRSLAQEIAETLRHNGHWVPKEWCGPDLITAVGMALQKRQQPDAEREPAPEEPKPLSIGGVLEEELDAIIAAAIAEARGSSGLREAAEGVVKVPPFWFVSSQGCHSELWDAIYALRQALAADAKEQTK